MLSSALFRRALPCVAPNFRNLSTIAKIKSEPIIIEASKMNIDQSPWRMNFLVKLVRGAWVPDALAQLRFSPKHKAVDVSKIVQRAVSLAKLYHEAIPEELIVKEIWVNKGYSQKRMRIMGRGRTGIGYMRKSHVKVKLEKINFGEVIEKAKTPTQKSKWAKRQELVVSIKNGTAKIPVPPARPVPIV